MSITARWKRNGKFSQSSMYDSGTQAITDGGIADTISRWLDSNPEAAWNDEIAATITLKVNNRQYRQITLSGLQRG